MNAAEAPSLLSLKGIFKSLSFLKGKEPAQVSCANLHTIITWTWFPGAPPVWPAAGFSRFRGAI